MRKLLVTQFVDFIKQLKTQAHPARAAFFAGRRAWNLDAALQQLVFYQADVGPMAER